jgi:hypothetical protein
LLENGRGPWAAKRPHQSLKLGPNPVGPTTSKGGTRHPEAQVFTSALEITRRRSQRLRLKAAPAPSSAYSIEEVIAEKKQQQKAPLMERGAHCSSSGIKLLS